MTLLDPIETARRIDDAFLGYLRSTYGPRREDLRADFDRAVGESRLMSRGPFLQATAPFTAGRSVRELIADGVLSPGFEGLADSFPLDRPLYFHQDQAIEKAVSRHRNLVVSTGTGSGKTEAFLLPIVDHLLRERDAGTLSRPGVRALLLYPMNALANDQVKRLREMLASVPDITFGRYTGETKKSRSDAEDDFRQRFPGAELLPNELISREVMQETPPHLLLTNYAMLEYLLLRPADTPFFDGDTAQDWRFMVLDEAHVYNGSQGTEIAYLLRRLRDRVVGSEPGRLQCFALSATLGRGREDHPDLVEFASQLFGEPFEWSDGDPQRQDVITASRVPFRSPDQAQRSLDTDQIAALHERFRAGGSAKDLAAAAGIDVDGLGDVAPAEMLRRILEDDANVLRVQTALAEHSRAARDLAKEVFGDDPQRELRLVQLVDLAVNARTHDDDLPLVPARYHHFVRSLEGAFVCLHPQHPVAEPRVVLTRRSRCAACRNVDVDSAMFELSVCRRCRAEYVVGVPVHDDGADRLVRANDFDTSRRYYLLGDAVDEHDDDEAIVVDEQDQPVEPVEIAGEMELCTGCSAIVDPGDPCGCSSPRVKVTAVEPPKGTGGAIRSCASCSGRAGNEVITRFVTGTDAPVTVVATELYQHLPPSTDEDAADQPGAGRKLLTFSDSRQDAAFFAGYLERTYGRSLHRALMLEAIRSAADPLRTSDLVNVVLRTAEDELVLDPDAGRSANRSAVSSWVTEELLAIDRRQSLEGTGQVRIELALPRKYRTPEPFVQLGISGEEAEALVQLLVGTLRHGCVITMLDGVDIREEQFAPRNREVFVRGMGGETTVLGWSPADGHNNRRLDILQKVIDRVGSGADARGLLQRFWVHLTDPKGPWKSTMESENNHRFGAVWRLDVERFEFLPRDRVPGPYRCDRCRELSWWNVAGVCPAWRCGGSLHSVADAEIENEHYAELYRRLRPISMAAQEHTAQWQAREAANVQQQFIDGDVNVLSCSTTFEMGVDVGDLQAVLLRNVPPSVANYVQRAGRAGRRTDSAALVVTFAQRRNHDRTFYDQPRTLIDGTVSPPTVLLDNVHIARRHAHSVAFAAFLRRCVEQETVPPDTVGSFFSGEERDTDAGAFEAWLRSSPGSVGDALARILPPPVADRLGVGGWNWVGALFEESSDDLTHGWFPRAAEEVREDLKRLAELRADAVEQQKGYAIERYKRLERTIRGRELIGYLSSRNVLPKYGFPVDVVELNLRGSGDAIAPKLELQRDLALAISDYAPGTEVVAGKCRWVSTGLAQRPSHSWPSYGWAVCRDCGAFRRALEDCSAECHVCGSAKLLGGHAGRFVIPIFGFLGRAIGPSGESRPRKRGYAEPYFTTDEQAEFVPVPGLGGQIRLSFRVSRQGRITLINRGALNGYAVCDWCGWAGEHGSKKGHDDPRMSGRRCKGPVRTVQLGHEFFTDVLELRFDDGLRPNVADAVLYALIESVGALGVSRDEVNGTTYVHANGVAPTLVLYDAVPGGAGHCQRLTHRLPELMAAGYRRVAECECASDTSCYSCLRSYRNQRLHEQLRRGDAARVLEQVLNA